MQLAPARNVPDLETCLLIQAGSELVGCFTFAERALYSGTHFFFAARSFGNDCRGSRGSDCKTSRDSIVDLAASLVLLVRRRLCR